MPRNNIGPHFMLCDHGQLEIHSMTDSEIVSGSKQIYCPQNKRKYDEDLMHKLGEILHNTTGCLFNRGKSAMARR